MRRPRHKLQVSTFPFLAVLLGAMGSLIFLLLVMDRRAKVVAMNKVREAREAHVAARTDADDLRRQEWERQRLRLHETLAGRELDLRGQLQQLVGELAKASQQMEQEATGQQRLQMLLAAEQAKLAKDREDLQYRQAALLKGVGADDASKTHLVRLTRDLVELEQTLAGLKRLKDQQQPTYSLVPYRGQRGESRMPIYVECTRSGLVFLPERLTLSGDELDVARVRAEVERRHGPLLKAQKADPFRAATTSDQPYVLFLIRPDGIGSYYRGQNALRGYQIDFGYELVDAEWTLDVPGLTPPLAAASNRPALVRTPETLKGPGAGGAPWSDPMRPGGRAAPSADVSLGTPHGMNDPGGRAVNDSTGRAGLPHTPGGATLSGTEPPHGPGPSPVTARIGNKVAASGAVEFRPAQPVAPQPAAPQAAAPDGLAPGLRIPGAIAKTAAGSGESPSGSAQTTGVAQKAPVSAGAAKIQTKDTEPPEPGGSLGRLTSPRLTSEQKPPPARPASLGRVIGNRDFIVTLACYEEGVLVTPGGASFVWQGKADARQVDEELVRTVAQLVSRRQATVRPGEPPYRAVLRFEVRERGRRTYHRAYPLLESLRLPMVREDVED